MSGSKRPFRDDPNVPASRLREIAIFADLDDDQINWLRSRFTMIRVEPGDVVSEEGDPADTMYVVLEGTLRARVERGTPDGRLYVMTPGTVTGMLPHSRLTHFPVTVRVDEPALVGCLPAEDFQEMASRVPVLMPRLASVMADRIRANAEQDNMRERLIGLGQLSAGLAHELNNPAAAIQRSVRDLGERIDRLADFARGVLERLEGSESVGALFAATEGPREALVEDPLLRSEAEERMAEWLESRGVPEPWLAAEGFVSAGVGIEQLTAVERLPSNAQSTLLQWLDAHLASERLVREISEASSRISELVSAVKSYSHMDRANARSDVDIHEGLEATMTVLGHKVRDKGIRLVREFGAHVPSIQANAGQLNQVWTNLIDNAVDASPEGGEVTVRTKAGPGHVVVQVVDEGMGIPAEVRQRIFEPFFTTKGVGVGTGLGLDVVQRIVTAHRGIVRVDSEPGRTCFEIQLPVDAPA